MNIIFLGSTHFAKEALKYIVEKKIHSVELIVTPVDKKRDRKNNIVMNDVAKFALEHNIPLLQTHNINLEEKKLSKYESKNILVCAFGQFLQKHILTSYNCINIHPSLLPKLRGGAPINWALMLGYKKTGVSIMKLISKMDAGSLYFQEKISITPEDDFFSLEKKLLTLIDKKINIWLSKIEKNKFKLIKQKEKDVTFGLNILSKDLKINWNFDSERIINLINGVSNIGAKTSVNGVNFNVFRVSNAFDKEFWSEANIFKNGTVVKITKRDVFIKTNDGVVCLKEIQQQNKNRLTISEFLQGNKVFTLGDIFD